MDIKTLSIIIGHVSSSTTLNIYAHITDEMRRTAAVKIGYRQSQFTGGNRNNTSETCPSTFQAHKGQRRKAGTGSVTRISEKLWGKRYSLVWLDGKSTPATFTPTARRSAKRCWQN